MGLLVYKQRPWPWDKDQKQVQGQHQSQHQDKTLDGSQNQSQWQQNQVHHHLGRNLEWSVLEDKLREVQRRQPYTIREETGGESNSRQSSPNPRRAEGLYRG